MNCDWRIINTQKSIYLAEWVRACTCVLTRRESWRHWSRVGIGHQWLFLLYRRKTSPPGGWAKKEEECILNWKRGAVPDCMLPFLFYFPPPKRKNLKKLSFFFIKLFSRKITSSLELSYSFLILIFLLLASIFQSWFEHVAKLKFIFRRRKTKTNKFAKWDQWS